MMATVFDVAAYILGKRGAMSAMKLQKLVYYAQAWSLVWDERPLFSEEIQAWANGPVCVVLYSEGHGGQFLVESASKGRAEALDANARETVDAVLLAYGNRSPQWLSDLTHSEAPWRDARKGLKDGERGAVPISHVAMAEYYGSLPEESSLLAKQA
jgi:uncharacterized phage-associated protein